MKFYQEDKPLYVAIDFDGTCVTHNYPVIGKDIGAQDVLKKLLYKGHKLILYTMRSDETLWAATDWFASNKLTLYGVNNNPTQKTWTTSIKVYANIYIDDAALGVPLLFDEKISDRPYVDWIAVEQLLKERKVL